MMNRLSQFGCSIAVLGCLGLVVLSGGQVAALDEVSSISADKAEAVVFASGKEGYPRHRIPAIVHTNKGTLLAFCEGRTGGDSGNIDMVLKRSTDSGKTWPVRKLINSGASAYSNLVVLPDFSLGLLYETQGYAKIAFATFSME